MADCDNHILHLFAMLVKELAIELKDKLPKLHTNTPNGWSTARDLMHVETLYE